MQTTIAEVTVICNALEKKNCNCSNSMKCPVHKMWVNENLFTGSLK